MPRHPAKYTDTFIPIFCDILNGCENVIDPFAGTGKIGEIKKYGYCGKVFANEIEKDWLNENRYGCDVITFQDAEFLDYPREYFAAICTSPTYGNRMADCHCAKDGSRRNTYTHCLGRQLNDENTGKMQWGDKYRQKHIYIYKHLYSLLQKNGLFVVNIKNHIRKGQEVDVANFHKQALLSCGLVLRETKFIKTPSLKYGANADKRVKGEYIMVFKKGEGPDGSWCS